jgi:BASS family bile acid:Na+ symporter
MGVEIEVFLPLALFVIMFSLGLGLGPADFRRIAAQPRDVLVGMASQIVSLPAVAFPWPSPGRPRPRSRSAWSSSQPRRAA